jgi:hypothetical protein
VAVKRFTTSLISQGKSYGVMSGRINLGIISSGGTVTEIGGYRIYSFTNVGSSNFIVGRQNLINIDCLIVAGGGGTRNTTGAGGGAGGYLSLSLSVLSNNEYVVQVGQGGALNSNSKGGDSSVFNQTAFGGGVGGAIDSLINGGSGGGWGSGTGTGGTGISGQGTNGGNGVAVSHGGGGGGATQAGNVRGNGRGGNGATNSISGQSQAYSGGGNWVFAADSVGGLSGNPGRGGGNDGDNGGNGIVIIRHILINEYQYD